MVLQNMIDDHPNWGRILKILDYYFALADLLATGTTTDGVGGGGGAAMKGVKKPIGGGGGNIPWTYLAYLLFDELFFLIFFDLRLSDLSDLSDSLPDEGVLDLFFLFSLSFLRDDLLSDPISYILII